MSTKEEAAIIRDEFKRRGWTSKMVSVRIHLYSMGSNITLTLKDARVPYYEAKAIGELGERIHRDGWGEILGGANRFVHVNTSGEYDDALGAPHMDALTSACAELEASTNDNALMPVGACGVFVGWDQGRRGMWMRLWLDHAEMGFDHTTADGRRNGACRVAMILQRREFEKRQAERLQLVKATG